MGSSQARACVVSIPLVLSVGAVAYAAPPPPDRVPPTRPTIDGERRTDDLRPAFTFGARDRRTPPSRLRFRCALDGASLRPCPRIYRPTETLAFGQHVLRAQAIDRAGNKSRVASYAFTVVGTWEAAEDFARAPSPANPGPDRYGNTTWFYLYSGTVAHDPTNYHPLSVFAVLDPNWQVWRNTADGMSGSSVGVNGARMIMHPGHYNLGQNAVLGWRSPVASAVKVIARLETVPLSVCSLGTGVLWSIDRGSTTLKSGFLSPGGTTNNMEVAASFAVGETLYVVVDGGAETTCDTTFVDLTVLTQ